MARLVVDPVTRIEGHLRIEAELSDGAIADAWSSGTMWRGIETILTGRDPRAAWYFAQRICGVCTAVHALGSVRAVEDALGIEPPPAAKLLRDLIAVSQLVHDHVIHFYHLHLLDWVDVTMALKADPQRTARLAASLTDAGSSDADRLRSVRDRLRHFVEGGQLGPFASGYWGHPGYTASPELDLLALSHYLDALEFQRSYVRLHALIGGKNPHPQTYLVGGIAKPIDPSSTYALNGDEISQIRGLLAEGLAFVEQVYLPDALAIAASYKEWFSIGSSGASFLSFGDLDDGSRDLTFPAGIVRSDRLGTLTGFSPDKIAEYVSHSWFAQSDDERALAPSVGETDPSFTGPEPPFDQLDVEGKYSWIKSPRYDDEPMEVGPAARLLVGWAAGSDTIRTSIESALATLGVGLEALSSTMGRTIARAVETGVVVRHAQTIVDRLEDLMAAGDWRIHAGSWNPDGWPHHARGLGLVEAPRGSLSHWIEIADGKISRYQVVAPTTWNAGPRDANGKRGPYESALVGTPIAEPTRPLEILRTLHSFDPCVACAAHLVDTESHDLPEVKVQ